jgi:hypothetical protein
MSEGHECQFARRMRVAPCGGNRHNVSVLVGACKCGRLGAVNPEKLNWFQRRWIERVNTRVGRLEKEASVPA